MPVKLQKRKFFIIAHNPNTIAEAKDFLDAGANALEPDICVQADKPGKYFVSHGHDGGANNMSPKNSIIAYLTGLKKLLTEKGTKRNLALIMFDYKDPDSTGEINEFLKIVHDNFSKFAGVCANVAIGVTVGSLDDIGFLTKFDQVPANDRIGIGIDEWKVPSEVADAFVSAKQKRYSYANGIITTFTKLGVMDTMLLARHQQTVKDGERMKLIYTWVLADSSAMRNYLHIHIDGIIVNISTVAALKAILLEKEFLPIYELAQNGYNPWGALPMPQYSAECLTSNADLAGTDATILFELIGTAGSLFTPFNSDYKNLLEAGGTTFVPFDGANIGTITGLKMTALNSDINSDWLPAMITVHSTMSSDVFFNFGPEEWLIKGSPITKSASAAPAI